MNDLRNIYNDRTYVCNNPSLHTEDSQFKFENIESLLNDVPIRNGHLRILDVGGGAGLLGLYVHRYFENRNVMVTMHALDLSEEMLKLQKLNNANLEKVFNCGIENFSERNYDLVLMIDVIEHIPDYSLAAETLNRISNYVIYNIPIEINASDLLRNVFNKFTFYREQTRLLGHLHFFSYIRAKSFLKDKHNFMKGYFISYNLLILNSSYEGYVKMRSSKLRILENKVANWLNRNLKFLCPFLIQGSYYSLVKSKLI
jgi:ubiquinone/menaquinone biosynthesis C-methylase UbiE